MDILEFLNPNWYYRCRENLHSKITGDKFPRGFTNTGEVWAEEFHNNSWSPADLENLFEPVDSKIVTVRPIIGVRKKLKIKRNEEQNESCASATDSGKPMPNRNVKSPELFQTHPEGLPKGKNRTEVDNRFWFSDPSGINP